MVPNDCLLSVLMLARIGCLREEFDNRHSESREPRAVQMRVMMSSYSWHVNRLS
jgi:hypothetical protein